MKIVHCHVPLPDVIPVCFPLLLVLLEGSHFLLVRIFRFCWWIFLWVPILLYPLYPCFLLGDSHLWFFKVHPATGLRLARHEYLRHRPRTCPARRSTSAHGAHGAPWLPCTSDRQLVTSQRIFAGIVIPKMKGAILRNMSFNMSFNMSQRGNCEIVKLCPSHL